MSPSRTKSRLILAVMCIAVLIVVIDNTIVNVALPTLSERLSASDAGLQWIVDSYSLAFAGLLLAGGEISDRWGRRRVMQVALVAFAVFSVMAAESGSLAQLLVARAFMGASAAFIFPATLSIVTTTFEDPEHRATAFGIWGATAGIAIAVGPIAGGYLIDHYWWGSVFIVNVPVAILTVALMALTVPESRSPVVRRVDYAGLFLVCSSISALVLGIIEGPSWGWLSIRVVTLFVAATLLYIDFGVYENARVDPLLDLRLFKRASFSSASAAIATSFFCLFGFIFLVTQYLQLVLGYSALSAGVHTLPFAIAVAVTTPLGAVVAWRIGVRWVVSAGLVIMGVAMMMLTTFTAHEAYWGRIIVVMVVLAIGFSMISSPSTAALMSSLSRAQIGSGAAVNETTRQMGGTLGVAVVGSVFSSLFGQRIVGVLRPLHVSQNMIAAARSSMQAALRVAASLDPPSHPQVAVIAHQGVVEAFLAAFHRGCLVAGIVAMAVGIGALGFLPGERHVATSETSAGDAAAV